MLTSRILSQKRYGKVLSPDIGEDAGRRAISVQSLNGLKSAGAAIWKHLVDCMHQLVLILCPDDVYLWVKPVIRPDDGFNYYANVVIYVDDVMVIHHNAESVLRRIYN